MAMSLNNVAGVLKVTSRRVKELASAGYIQCEKGGYSQRSVDALAKQLSETCTAEEAARDIRITTNDVVALGERGELATRDVAGVTRYTRRVVDAYVLNIRLADTE